MLPKITVYVVFLLVLLSSYYTNAQTKSLKVIRLEDAVQQFNNNNEYELSFKKIIEFLNSKDITNEDAYYGNLFLADTYKRIYDYNNVLVYLDKVQSFAENISVNKSYYIDNSKCQKAFALFDIQHYKEADSLMEILAKTNYVNINARSQSMLLMQKAYLYYLDKSYYEAEKQYDFAIAQIKSTSPCDLPIIYGKKIALYGAMNNRKKLNECYILGLKYADSCKIIKYNLYLAEMMRNTHKDLLKDYKTAYFYFDKYDSIYTIFNTDEYKKNLSELEIKYETNKKNQEILIKEKTITNSSRLIALLLTTIVILILMIALVITIQRRKKLIKEKTQSQLFTKQLLDKTEEERKRIATDLHDSVNNDLLLIKSSVDNNPQAIKPKINLLINHVRAISRNLHPVMFEELGLQDSIEQLVERTQEYHQFVLNTEIDYKPCLTSNDELQLYRIIQESVNNIIKYSKAEAAIITINQYKEKLVIEIKDNGKGFDVENTLKNKNSFGLHNIIERANAINGKAHITSSQNGTTIKIEIQI